MSVPPEFAAAVAFRVFDFGPKGGLVVRSEHPALPGHPVLGLLEPGLPDSSLQDKKAACIVALHTEFTALPITADDWNII